MEGGPSGVSSSVTAANAGTDCAACPSSVPWARTGLVSLSRRHAPPCANPRVWSGFSKGPRLLPSEGTVADATTPFFSGGAALLAEPNRQSPHKEELALICPLRSSPGRSPARYIDIPSILGHKGARAGGRAQARVRRTGPRCTTKANLPWCRSRTARREARAQNATKIIALPQEPVTRRQTRRDSARKGPKGLPRCVHDFLSPHPSRPHALPRRGAHQKRRALAQARWSGRQGPGMLVVNAGVAGSRVDLARVLLGRGALPGGYSAIQGGETIRADPGRDIRAVEFAGVAPSTKNWVGGGPPSFLAPQLRCKHAAILSLAPPSATARPHGNKRSFCPILPRGRHAATGGCQGSGSPQAEP